MPDSYVQPDESTDDSGSNKETRTRIICLSTGKRWLLGVTGILTIFSAIIAIFFKHDGTAVAVIAAFGGAEVVLGFIGFFPSRVLLTKEGIDASFGEAKEEATERATDALSGYMPDEVRAMASRVLTASASESSPEVGVIGRRLAEDEAYRREVKRVIQNIVSEIPDANYSEGDAESEPGIDCKVEKSGKVLLLQIRLRLDDSVKKQISAQGIVYGERELLVVYRDFEPSPGRAMGGYGQTVASIQWTEKERDKGERTLLEIIRSCLSDDS